MPLVPDGGRGVVRIEIDDDWYELREELSWYYLEQADASMLGIAVRVPWRKVQSGLDLERDENVQLTLERMADANVQRLGLWLKAWSHQERITAKNIKRLPVHHARRLLEEIDKLEKQLKEKLLTGDDPLAES